MRKDAAYTKLKARARFQSLLFALFAAKFILKYAKFNALKFTNIQIYMASFEP